MAIFHLSVKAVSRSDGRTATAAAAYRSGALITDGRTGEVHDYRRKRGIVHAEVVRPAGPAFAWAADRAALWNAAEAAERRKDACVAREYEVALPSELSDEQRRRLVLQFAQAMADQEGCAVDVAIHRPGREGDSRNHHAHILRTTRKVADDGTLSAKLDTEKAGRNRRADLEALRASWADLCNEHLREAGIDAQVDHRSLKDQGVERVPTSHLGPAVTALERRGQRTQVTRRIEEEVTARLEQAKKDGELERAAGRLDQIIIDLSGNLDAAKAERGQLQEAAARAYARQAAEQFKTELQAEAKRKDLTRSLLLDLVQWSEPEPDQERPGFSPGL